jgi:hypothetical protein
MVSRGKTPAQADQIVNQVNGVAGFGLAIAARRSFKRGKRFYGFMFSQLALLAFGFAAGLIREKRK